MKTFIPQVEPAHKRARDEAILEADPTLAAMRGREEEYSSDAVTTSLHLAYLGCSGCSTLSSSSSTDLNAARYDTLKLASEAFAAEHALALNFSCKVDERSQTQKNSSPQAATYNSQSRPAAGTLITVLLFLARETQKSEAQANLPQSVLVHLLNFMFPSELHDTLSCFARWLCIGLETGSLWPPKKAKTKIPLLATEIVAADNGLQDILSSFNSGPAGTCECLVPLCVQLQRLELLSWILANIAGPRSEGTTVALLTLAAKVAMVLVGGVGAEHHTHNARRNVAAWQHLSYILKYLSPIGAGACPFVTYLDDRILMSFVRRDRGISTTANLYRRRLEEAAVAYDGTTMEALHERHAALGPGSSGGELAPQHTKGYHAQNSVLAQAPPSAAELDAAKSLLCVSFNLNDSFFTSAHQPLLVIVAHFWLRPPCVAAA